MGNTLTHTKGYTGSLQYSPQDEVFHGRIEAIADLVTFEANSANQLQMEFEAAVDDYLETPMHSLGCAEWDYASATVLRASATGYANDVGRFGR